MPRKQEIDLEDEEPPTIEPYKVLGIEKSATADEVKAAYRKAALKHHPGKYSILMLPLEIRTPLGDWKTFKPIICVKILLHKVLMPPHRQSNPRNQRSSHPQIPRNRLRIRRPL